MSGAPPMQPVNPDDPGRGPTMMGLTWTWTSLSLIVVAARFWVRIAVIKALAVEDWLMLLAAMLNLACQACLTVAWHHGFGKHDASLTVDQTINVAYWVWMQFTPGLTSSIVARLSIMILLIRLFGRQKWMKWTLIIITVVQIVSNMVVIITSWVQVVPVQGLWDPFVPARRIDPNVVVYEGNVAGSLSALGDLLYVLLPVMIVWKLHMPFSRKFGLCFLLALSLFTMGASIAKAATAGNGRGTGEVMYKSSMSIIWSVTEQAFVIMMGCAPPLRKFTQLPQVLSVSESFRRLVSTPRSTASDSKNPDGPSGGDSNGMYHELGRGEWSISKAHAGRPSPTFHDTGNGGVEAGKIRVTDQYSVGVDPREP